MKAFTKNYLSKIVSECGGHTKYSGHTRTMYIYNLIDRWTFNVLTAYLFNDIKIEFINCKSYGNEKTN